MSASNNKESGHIEGVVFLIPHAFFGFLTGEFRAQSSKVEMEKPHRTDQLAHFLPGIKNEIANGVVMVSSQ